ncbi:hypothetical protein HN51_022423 [Arachis hypogaea]
MSATCIVFMCTKINCGRIRGSVESRIMYEIESRIDIEQPEHRANDLEPEPVMLDAIPILKSNQEAFSAIEDSQLSSVSQFQLMHNLLKSTSWIRNKLNQGVNEWITNSHYFYKCVICLADYRERKVLRIMPKCDHTFIFLALTYS